MLQVGPVNEIDSRLGRKLRAAQSAAKAQAKSDAMPLMPSLIQRRLQ